MVRTDPKARTLDDFIPATRPSILTEDFIPADAEDKENTSSGSVRAYRLI